MCLFLLTVCVSCLQLINVCTGYRALIAGGGAPEIELAIRLTEHSQTLTGMEHYCVRAFAEALDVIPFTLAENAGLNPIATVTELRNHHAQGQRTFGINVRKVFAVYRGFPGKVYLQAKSPFACYELTF